jgi:adenylate kinase
MKDVITKAVENLNKLAKKAENEAERPDAAAAGDDEENENNEESEEEEEEEEEAPDLGELETINETLESEGKLDDAFVLRFFKERLMSKPCQNQGFILDGFPKTREQAEKLFERN